MISVKKCVTVARIGEYMGMKSVTQDNATVGEDFEIKRESGGRLDLLVVIASSAAPSTSMADRCEGRIGRDIASRFENSKGQY